jgi:cytochrome c-type biogenesis protein CcmH
MRHWLAALLLTLAPIAAAVDAQHFDDPATQARYERLIHDLRCLVCQNESIADSNATLAADLRREVREMITAGQSDAEIRSFLTDRYGDFVLYRPPVTQRTWLLWAAPALFLAGGLLVVAFVIARRSRAARADPAALEEEPDRT